MKAIILNTTLKTEKDLSHTEALANETINIFESENIEVEMLRISVYHIAYGISEDMIEGDEWPTILEKIITSDIMIIETPL